MTVRTTSINTLPLTLIIFFFGLFFLNDIRRNYPAGLLIRYFVELNAKEALSKQVFVVKSHRKVVLNLEPTLFGKINHE